MNNWEDRYDLKISPDPKSDDELKRHMLMHHNSDSKDPDDFREFIEDMTSDPSSHMKDHTGQPRNYLREYHDDHHYNNFEDDYESLNHEHPWENND